MFCPSYRNFFPHPHTHKFIYIAHSHISAYILHKFKMALNAMIATVIYMYMPIYKIYNVYMCVQYSMCWWCMYVAHTEFVWGCIWERGYVHGGVRGMKTGTCDISVGRCSNVIYNRNIVLCRLNNTCEYICIYFRFRMVSTTRKRFR